MTNFPQPQISNDLIAFAHGLGKNLVRRTFGEQGPSLSCNLTSLESAAVEFARALVAGFLESATEQQVAQIGSHYPCPTCQQQCSVGHRPRVIETRGGPFELNEPVCQCARCRRAFFPFASRSATGWDAI